MIKDYPNLSLKLVAASILMIASISAVVFLYKDSQKRSLLYSHAYSTNKFTPNETSENAYPTIGKANNQRINSDNNYPSIKGSNSRTDYSPTETVVRTITTTTIGTGTQTNANYNNKQVNINTNSNIGTSPMISSNNSISPLSHNTSGNSASSNLSSTSIFADNGGAAGSTEISGNGRMLVDGDPGEPGVPIGNGNYILVLLICLYGFFKFKETKTIKNGTK
jgi:hypothetical protein